MGVLGIIGGAGDTDIGYGRYEVKRVFQFKVEFEATSGTVLSSVLTEAAKKSLTIAAQIVNKPKVTFNELVIKHGNESWKLAGRTNWSSDSAIQVDFDDVIPKKASGTGDSDPLLSASAILYDWQNIVQDITTGDGNVSEQYKGNMIVTQYNPAGEVVEKLLYYGVWPSDVTSVAWDYSQDDATNKVTAMFSVDKVFRLSTAAGTEENTPPATSQAGGIANDQGS